MDAAGRNLLLESDFLSSLTPEERERVAAAAAQRAIPAGEVLFREGDDATRLYFMLHGRLKLTQLTAHGHEVIVRYIGPGEPCGGVAVLGGQTYPVTGEAVQDGRALLWEGDALRRLAEEIPNLALSTTRAISQRMREVQDRFRELATERVAQRVARTLLRLARQAGRRVETGVLIDMPLSRQDLAEMNGTTLYTVSRILSEWESRGLVAAGRERVEIRAPHGLVRIAEDLPEPSEKA